MVTIPINIIEEYTTGKQTQEQISKKLGKSREWVNKYIQSNDFNLNNYNDKIEPQTITLIIDTTYFEQFGLMVFRASNLKKNLLWYVVSHETNNKYREGIQFLLDKGWGIEMLVADGKPGLGKMFPSIPFQLCQFHLFQMVTRYISKKPKLEAGIELRNLMFFLKETDQESFEYLLKIWKEKWSNFLNEKSENWITGKEYFTHLRLRQAYNSIKRALPYVFTAHQFLPKKRVCTTTNSLDGYFSHLKSKLSVHRGASRNTQIKIISVLIFS